MKIFVFFMWLLLQPLFAQSDPWFVQGLAVDGLRLSTPHSDRVLPVIDDGVQCSYQGLTGVISGKSYTGDDPCQSAGGHGTAVAWVAANVLQGSAKAASFRIVHQSTPSGYMGYTDAKPENIRQALLDLMDLPQGLVVANMSLAMPTDQLLPEVLKKIEKKVLLFVPAGNDGSSSVQDPCSRAYDFPNVVCVTAVDQNNKLWTLSNWGPRVDIAAFGVNLNGPYGPTGTSYASPSAAAVAELLVQAMLGRGMDPTPALLKKILVEGSFLNPNLEGERGGVPLLANPRQANGNGLLALATKVMSPMWPVRFETGIPFPNKPAVMSVLDAPVSLRQLDVTLVFRSNRETVRIKPAYVDSNTVTYSTPDSGHYLLSLEIEGAIVTNEQPFVARSTSRGRR